MNRFLVVVVVAVFTMSVPVFVEAQADRGVDAGVESAPHSVQSKADPVANLVDGLKARLQANPDDVNGWVLLARSYQHLQRWEEAFEAAREAKKRGYSEVIINHPQAVGSKSKVAAPARAQTPLDRYMARKFKTKTESKSGDK